MFRAIVPSLSSVSIGFKIGRPSLSLRTLGNRKLFEYTFSVINNSKSLQRSLVRLILEPIVTERSEGTMGEKIKN